MGATSLHFTDAELACHHCHVNGCQQAIVDALEQFRATIGMGRPVIVNSAYRCSIYNAEIGGVPDSEHVQGIAADITVEGMTGGQLEVIAKQCSLITAIGRSDSTPYVHVDTRKISQGRVLWAYNDQGKWVHYFPPPTDAPVEA
jgi:uncharacterized protein YcbK (DUF882 family)